MGLLVEIKKEFKAKKEIKAATKKLRLCIFLSSLAGLLCLSYTYGFLLNNNILHLFTIFFCVFFLYINVFNIIENIKIVSLKGSNFKIFILKESYYLKQLTRNLSSDNCNIFYYKFLESIHHPKENIDFINFIDNIDLKNLDKSNERIIEFIEDEEYKLKKADLFYNVNKFSEFKLKYHQIFENIKDEKTIFKEVDAYLSNNDILKSTEQIVIADKLIDKFINSNEIIKAQQYNKIIEFYNKKNILNNTENKKEILLIENKINDISVNFNKYSFIDLINYLEEIKGRRK